MFAASGMAIHIGHPILRTVYDYTLIPAVFGSFALTSLLYLLSHIFCLDKFVSLVCQCFAFSKVIFRIIIKAVLIIFNNLLFYFFLFHTQLLLIIFSKLNSKFCSILQYNLTSATAAAFYIWAMSAIMDSFRPNEDSQIWTILLAKSSLCLMAIISHLLEILDNYVEKESRLSRPTFSPSPSLRIV